MKKILFAIVFTVGLTIPIFAQSDEVAARACLENYMSSDSARVALAFHPSATMKYIDAKNELINVPIADFIARIKSGPAPQRKIEIVALNNEGNAANGKIKIETDKVILYDYMNMLKINGQWKIVSKIFSRQNK